jgi:hypothetical protein
MVDRNHRPQLRIPLLGQELAAGAGVVGPIPRQVVEQTGGVQKPQVQGQAGLSGQFPGPQGHRLTVGPDGSGGAVCFPEGLDLLPAGPGGGPHPQTLRREAVPVHVYLSKPAPGLGQGHHLVGGPAKQAAQPAPVNPAVGHHHKIPLRLGQQAGCGLLHPGSRLLEALAPGRGIGPQLPAPPPVLGGPAGLDLIKGQPGPRPGVHLPEIVLQIDRRIFSGENIGGLTAPQQRAGVYRLNFLVPDPERQGLRLTPPLRGQGHVLGIAAGAALVRQGLSVADEI